MQLREIRLTAPANGAVDVPPNTRLWHADYAASPQSRFTLTGLQGDVPLRTEALGPSSHPLGHVSTPEADLIAGGSYRFSVCRGAQPCVDLSRFTVADRRAEKPRIPVEVGKRSESYRSSFFPGDSCGSDPSRFAILSFDWEGVLLLINVADKHPYPADPTALLVQAKTAEDIRQDGGVRVGSGPCTGGWPRSGDGAADSAPVRFGAIDLAGNFSGWSDPVDVQLPDGCGCRLGGAAPGASALWMAPLLGLFALRKRRSR